MESELLDLAENYNAGRPEMAAHPDRPFEVYDILRKTAPVKRVTNQSRIGGTDGDGWLLTRYEDVWEVFRDDEHFTSIGILGDSDDESIPTGEVSLGEVDLRTMARMAQRIPMLMDPPEFLPYRRMMTPLFTPDKLAAREQDTRDLVNRLIDDFIETGTCDFQDQLGKPLPGILTCQLMGLPADRWRFFADPIDEFLRREGAEAFTTQAPSYEDSAFARMQVPGMMAMLEVAEERRREPKNDVISELVKISVKGRPLNAYELGAMLSILLSGGTETTTSALGSAFVYLGRNPALRARLAADPTAIPAFAEEVLRMWPPLMTFFRMVKKHRVLGGQQLVPGEMIYLGLAAANRDPDAFNNPNDFQPDRYPNRHVTFTVGVHRCVGSTLARLELRIGIEEVLRRMPDYQLVEDKVQLMPSFPSAYSWRKIGAVFPPGRREKGMK
jgi:cytochrome P450